MITSRLTSTDAFSSLTRGLISAIYLGDISRRACSVPPRAISEPASAASSAAIPPASAPSPLPPLPSPSPPAAAVVVVAVVVAVAVVVVGSDFRSDRSDDERPPRTSARVGGGRCAMPPSRTRLCARSREITRDHARSREMAGVVGDRARLRSRRERT